MKKLPIIIDCDPGVDDATALVYALKSPVFDVKAIHTVAGNVQVDQTTENALRLLDYLGLKVKVCKGANEPLVKAPVYAANIHGSNGLSGYELPKSQVNQVSNQSALESYFDIMNESEKPVTIFALGPLTNVALFIKAYPNLKKKIEAIYLMGGGIKGGNITPCGEFNFYADPHAARIVFDSQIPIVMAGLDVTEMARIHEEDYQSLMDKVPKIAQLLLNITMPAFGRYQNIGWGRVCTPNDLVPFIFYVYPEIFTAKHCHVSVSIDSGETLGQTFMHQRILTPTPANCQLITGVNLEAFRQVCMKGFELWQEKE